MSVNESEVPRMRALQQLDTYFAEPPIPRNYPCSQILEKQSLFHSPALVEIVCKYLSAPCTSTDSEQLFSSASYILDKKITELQQGGDAYLCEEDRSTWDSNSLQNPEGALHLFQAGEGPD